MQAIRIRGTFGYPSDRALDSALMIVRHQLADYPAQRRLIGDKSVHTDWLSAFARKGSTLEVDVALPPELDQDMAIGVLETLADAAMFGVVEMREGNKAVDWFPANCND